MKGRPAPPGWVAAWATDDSNGKLFKAPALSSMRQFIYHLIKIIKFKLVISF